MLLRRVMEYVNAQNWFAVGVDFVIVVVGVVIGIEVANWNDVRNNKAGLVASLERLDKEVVITSYSIHYTKLYGPPLPRWHVLGL